MASSCETLFPGYYFVGYDNYKLFKGILFDGSEADQYAMDVTPVSVDDVGLKCRVIITSDNAKGFRINHYAADILLQSSRPVQQSYADANLRDDAVMDGALLYTNGTLFHGPKFQGIDSVLNVNAQKMTLKCHATMVPAAEQGQFPLGASNIFTDDLMYQAMLVWARHTYGSGSLPSCAAHLEQFEVLTPGAQFYLTLDVVSHSASNLTADIILHDEQGQIYSMMQGGEVTISKSLNKLFE